MQSMMHGVEWGAQTYTSQAGGHFTSVVNMEYKLFRGPGSQINEAKDKLENLKNKPPTRQSIDECKAQCTPVNQLLQQEEVFQKTHVKGWKLKYGDHRTHYFHERVKLKEEKLEKWA